MGAVHGFIYFLSCFMILHHGILFQIRVRVRVSVRVRVPVAI